MNQTKDTMTDFRQDKAIYLQMADRICDGILSGEYRPGDRIPSVRELAVFLGVNANTVVKSYERLSRQGIIQTRRGMGYYVTEDAMAKILDDHRTRFLEETLPEVFRQMQLLGIPAETLTEKREEWLRSLRTD